MTLADELIKSGVIVLCFDPSCDWIQRSSIQRYVTVRSYTAIEVPTESQIYDLTALTLKQQKEFVESFNRALFDYQITHGSSWYFCIYEEAHQYFQQGCLRSNNMQYSVRLLTQGRNFKISMALITQFGAMLDKDAMKFMEQRFIWQIERTERLRVCISVFPQKAA
jgi:DNA helicase HerA-like ATPase